MEMDIWSDEFDGAVTICDLEGVITYMNEKSKKQFEKYEGGVLPGNNLIYCHPEPSRTMLLKMLKEPITNTYTTEKRGIKKLIHQAPLFENGVFSGLVEISFVIPREIPHYIRD
jgi:transcriptional regulator with PAS, ATPase and Fis domain